MHDTEHAVTAAEIFASSFEDEFDFVGIQLNTTESDSIDLVTIVENPGFIDLTFDIRAARAHEEPVSVGKICSTLINLDDSLRDRSLDEQFDTNSQGALEFFWDFAAPEMTEESFREGISVSTEDKAEYVGRLLWIWDMEIDEAHRHQDWGLMALELLLEHGPYRYNIALLQLRAHSNNDPKTRDEKAAARQELAALRAHFGRIGFKPCKGKRLGNWMWLCHLHAHPSVLFP